MQQKGNIGTLNAVTDFDHIRYNDLHEWVNSAHPHSISSWHHNHDLVEEMKLIQRSKFKCPEDNIMDNIREQHGREIMHQIPKSYL